MADCSFDRLGILVFALMVVAIAVCLALMIMTCILKARTRQRDEMEARVEELELILMAKAQELRGGESLLGESNIYNENQKQGSMASISNGLRAVAARAASSATKRKQTDPVPLLPSQTATAAASPYVQLRATRPNMTPHQVPLPESVPSYDHSKGEAFTTSPDTFSTPMDEPMHMYAQSHQDPHLAQIAEAIAGPGDYCPPNVAWLTDVLVDSPQPESARLAKAADK